MTVSSQRLLCSRASHTKWLLRQWPEQHGQHAAFLVCVLGRVFGKKTLGESAFDRPRVSSLFLLVYSVGVITVLQAMCGHFVVRSEQIQVLGWIWYCRSHLEFVGSPWFSLSISSSLPGKLCRQNDLDQQKFQGAIMESQNDLSSPAGFFAGIKIIPLMPGFSGDNEAG